MADFSDIDMNLTMNEFSDISLVTDLEAVKQAMINCIMVKRGSKMIFQEPIFGSNLHKVLFEKMSNVTVARIRREIESALRNFEPRVKIHQILVDSDEFEKRYIVRIEYRVINLNKDDEVSFDLETIS